MRKSPRPPPRRKKHASGRASLANATSAGPSFPDITPRIPPRNAPTPEPIPRSSKPRLTNRLASNEVYPAPTPENPVMRIKGEPSISTERVTLSVRLRFNPLRGLTPDRLSQYLDQFDLGFFRLAAITWDKIERRDYTLKSVAPKRKKSVARHGWEILTINNVPDELKGMAEDQVKELTYFFNNLSVTDAIRPDQVGGVSLLVRQMLDAHSKYWAVHEVVYQPKPEGLTAQFVFCPLWWFEAVTGKLRYLDNEFQVYGRDMVASEWMITSGDGLMEACSVAWMFKNLSLQDWVAFCEKFGGAFIDAATSAEPGSDQWEALKAYVQNFGPDGGGVRSQSSTIQLVESKSNSAEVFHKMVENMDRAMTIIWRGGDLGTSGKKDATGASLQQDESGILETDDAALIEETLATNVVRYVIKWRFGPDAPVLAYIKFRQSEQQNLTQDLAVDQWLVSVGAPLEINTTLERYGRPVPPEGSKLLTKPASPIPAPKPGEQKNNPQDDPEFENTNPDLPALEESAHAQYAQAVADDLQRIREIMAALLEINDDKLFAQRAQDAVGEIEKLKRDILHLPRSAQVLAETQIAALFTGLTEQTRKRKAS